MLSEGGLVEVREIFKTSKKEHDELNAQIIKARKALKDSKTTLTTAREFLFKLMSRTNFHYNLATKVVRGEHDNVAWKHFQKEGANCLAYLGDDKLNQTTTFVVFVSKGFVMIFLSKDGSRIFIIDQQGNIHSEYPLLQYAKMLIALRNI